VNKSFVDCSKCEYKESKQSVCLTNCQSDLSKVDVLYVTDYIDSQKKMEDFAKEKKEKYLITSVVLCEAKTGVPFSSVIDYCKSNVLKIHDLCKPKRIITHGTISKNMFKNSEEFQVEKQDMNSQSKKIESDIAIDLSELEATLINPKLEKDIVKEQPVVAINDNKDIYMYKIDEKFYTDEYRLVDVQYISYRDQVIFIFRDKNNNKIFYDVPKKHSNYYWYESVGNKIIEKIENLQLMIGNYQQRNLGPKCYESDIKIEVKHAVDYYLQSKGEPAIVTKNVLFYDIEVYTYKDNIFPVPDKAAYPISAISFCFDGGPVHIYLLSLTGEIDPKINEIVKSKQFEHLTVFTDESTIIKAFFAKIKEYKPDYLCGWNICRFDLPYITGRMRKFKISSSALSPYDNVYADYKSGRNIVTGYVVLDQLQLYKDLTYSSEPSYTLDSIAQKIVGESKERYEGNLTTLYNKDIERFIKYSIQDTALLRKLEDSLHHIMLQDELRKAATTTYGAAQSTIGLADGLFMTSMKKKNLSAKNAGTPEKEELPGAYVFNPRGGLFSGLLCDFDFTSLYPSIINSWNLGPNTYFGKIDSEIAFLYLYDKTNLKDKKFKFKEDPIHSVVSREIDIVELEKIINENNATVNITGCLFKGHDKEESIYYTIIESLFKNRKKFKNIMFEYKQKGDKINTRIFDGKQQAVKILMNSLYGVLANEHFRFYNNDLASSITLSGQELLKFSSVHCNRYMCGVKGIDKDFMRVVETQMEYVIYGDTDSMFVNLTDYLKKKNIQSEEVEKEIKVIQNYLNKELLVEFAKDHRIPANKSMIEIKNEYLFSKYYSLNVKKKYATKVIAQEGRKLDFIDIKGLEMKRSDIPKISQELLQKVLEMILSDDFNITKVNKCIEDTKTEVATRAARGDIGVTKSVAFSKPVEEYKTLTQNIKAMQIWNLLVNEDFRHGSRGHLFPIVGIDFNKAPESVKRNYSEKFLKKFKPSDLNVVCLPEEFDKLPEYFIPNVKQIVSFSVAERTDLILEPLVKKTQDLLLF